MISKEQLISEYEQELYNQLHPYEMWINDNEGAELIDKDLDKDSLESFALFFDREGAFAPKANEIFSRFFLEHKDYSFAYCDEDVIVDGVRTSPWFKPEFSPDTIESVNYFGSVFAIKKKLLLDILGESHIKNDRRYDFVRKCIDINDTTKIIRISFGKEDYEAYWNIIRKAAIAYSGGHIDRILYHASCPETFTKTIVHNRYEVLDGTLLSIIIPSKDNPKMLEKCIESACNKANLTNEIIVVDNGSNAENRKECETLSTKFGFKYIYNEMSFNFSKMCNIGAMAASGNVFLFLNDDITVETKGYDEIMVSQATRALTGAVGAKLYYPDSHIIQHDGITNMGIGPAHKLCGIDDDGLNIYHGRNLADYNVYAVTAAALCITKEKFAECLCFDEKLSVAYNDVDLCFKLFDRGYYNIIRNDVVMYHHESVSRGSDESKEKKARLLKERAILYNNHPESIRFDPFYSKHLVQDRYDGEYNIGYLYSFEIDSMLSKVDVISTPLDSSSSIIRKVMRKGPICQLNVDTVKKVNSADLDIISIEGWAGLTDLDQCLYDRFLILNRKDGTSYKISMFNKLRDDASLVMQAQKYNKLLGFTCHIDRKYLTEDVYKYGIMFTNRINGKNIVYYNSDDNGNTINIGDSF